MRYFGFQFTLSVIIMLLAAETFLPEHTLLFLVMGAVGCVAVSFATIELRETVKSTIDAIERRQNTRS